MKKCSKIIIIVIIGIYICLWALTWIIGSKGIDDILHKRTTHILKWELLRKNRRQLEIDLYDIKALDSSISIETYSPVPFILKSETIQMRAGKYGFCIHSYWVWFFGYKHEISSSTEWLHKLRVTGFDKTPKEKAIERMKEAQAKKHPKQTEQK